MTDISRTDGGPVVVEYANGDMDYISNPNNMRVTGKMKPAKNADFVADGVIRIGETNNPALFEFMLSDITIGGVAPSDIEDAKEKLAELLTDVVV